MWCGYCGQYCPNIQFLFFPFKQEIILAVFICLAILPKLMVAFFFFLLILQEIPLVVLVGLATLPRFTFTFFYFFTGNSFSSLLWFRILNTTVVGGLQE